MFKSIVVPIDIAHGSSWEFALPQAIELAQSDRGMVGGINVPVMRLSMPHLNGKTPARLRGTGQCASRKTK